MNGVVLRLALACCGAIFSSGATVGHAQPIADVRFSVRNNTAIALPCQVRHGDAPWRQIELAPGGEWREPVDQRDAVAHVRCVPPVQQVAYRLRPGRRYAFLKREGHAVVKLRKIEVQ